MSAPRKLHLEAELGNIADMSTICDHLVCEFANQLIAMKEMSLTGKQAIECSERNFGMLSFAVMHLSCMARQLKSRYLDELENPRSEIAGAS
jgi:hypothetical protein